MYLISYADDAVVHCKTYEAAEKVKSALIERMRQCKLELHPVKTRIIYCKDKDRTEDFPNTEFDFLGYTFKGTYIKCRDGKMRVNFIAFVSKKSAKNFRGKIKSMEIHKRTGSKISMIAEMLNPVIRGWVNYFGNLSPSARRYTFECIERRIVKWAMCKFKHF